MSERLLRLPKPELHVHLDGSLRPSTLLELAHERDVTLPASTVDALADHMIVSDAGNLEDYLRRFDVTLSVMQDAEALERIAYELASDNAADNVLYVEVRFAPLLCTQHGLDPDEVLRATLAGLAHAEADCDIKTGVIVCALRSHAPIQSVEMAELAIAYRGRGVCGFDIAGAEAGNPVTHHLEALLRVSSAGVPITIHAGEGYGAASIRQAVELGHADRIGHGTRLHEDPELLATIRERRIPMETCLTSNVQTHAVASYSEHPVKDYFDSGIAVTLCTDNRLMSGVTLTQEYQRAHDELGFSWLELVDLARQGLEHAFVEPEVRDDLLQQFNAGVSRLAS